MAVADILTTGAEIYYAPFGETLPDETTVAFGAAWGGNWVNLGKTTTPVLWNVNINQFIVDVQQTTLPVKAWNTNESHQFTTTLAEFTGANVALSMFGTNTDTAAGASQKAYSRIQIGGQRVVTLYAVGMEGYRPDSSGTLQPIRIFSFASSIVAAGSVPMDKANTMGIPLSITTFADLTNHDTEGQMGLEIHNVTGPTT